MNPSSQFWRFRERVRSCIQLELLVFFTACCKFYIFSPAAAITVSALAALVNIINLFLIAVGRQMLLTGNNKLKNKNKQKRFLFTTIKKNPTTSRTFLLEYICS